ncbi:hypothetical protein GJ25_gp080 [Mycobacterium phage Hawkeye]|uniref:Uncharacterized protein n=1 Tax=Mycobacterium phage Hawkeye TaxID=1458711 RepID=X2KSR5_9CAUD|nr:hypothetical protein GJ25_gp080 [Mycobacterium phage Hawkeye]AHN84091.1 hypothetical protein PBI_HAWKEYE_80 [Mycobacterium phage Hawkeye]
MNQIQAFAETLNLAEESGMADCDFEIEEVNFVHLEDMLRRIKANPDDFSDAKLGRWLGWAQACVVAGGYATLEDMKQINRRNS